MGVTENQIVDKFKEIAVKVTQKPLTMIDLQASFADLSIDSVQSMEIIGCLEDEFDIELKDHQLIALKNIEGLIKLIHKNANNE